MLLSVKKSDKHEHRVSYGNSTNPLNSKNNVEYYKPYEHCIRLSASRYTSALLMIFLGDALENL